MSKPYIMVLVALVVAGGCRKDAPRTVGEVLPEELTPFAARPVVLGETMTHLMKLRPSLIALPYTGAFERLAERWVIYETDPPPLDDIRMSLPSGRARVIGLTIGTEVMTLAGADSLFVAVDGTMRRQYGVPTRCVGGEKNSAGRVFSWRTEGEVISISRMRSVQRLGSRDIQNVGALVSVSVSKDMGSYERRGSAFGVRPCPPDRNSDARASVNPAQ